MLQLVVEIVRCGDGYIVRWHEGSFRSLSEHSYGHEGYEDGEQACSEWEDVNNTIAEIFEETGE